MNDKAESTFSYYLEQPTEDLFLKDANLQNLRGPNRTTKVGSYKANRLGLHDMHGNVWEWCDDLKVGKENSFRQRRGSSWADDSYSGRAGAHFADEQVVPRFDVGFRLVRVPVGKPAAILLPPEVTKPAAKPAKSFTNFLGMELIYIPPGKFTMGSPEQEACRRADEGPAREIEITRNFYIGKFEVTQGQYRKLMGKNPSWFAIGDDLPVENVSWNEDVEFCRKLSELEKKEYDLPTEAEWEYACRAGTQTPYYFGESLSKEQANFKPGLEKTQKVGSYPPNAWGLFDMHGNVSEWCKDWYESSYYREGPSQDPPGPTTGKERITRGGSFGTTIDNCRSANRHMLPPDFRSQHTGFRVVLR